MRYLSLLILIFSSLCTIQSQEWEPIAELPEEYKVDHAIGFSINGLGYSVTGRYPGYRKTVMEYNPVTDVWTELEEYPGPPRSYGVGGVWEEKGYIGFGSNNDPGFFNDLWEFNPIDSSWQELSSCPCEGRNHPAFAINNGVIYVGLGDNENGNLNDWWSYTIATETWLELPSFPGDPRHHPYQFSVGEYVYVGFGHGQGMDNLPTYRDWYRYSPNSSTWTQINDFPGMHRVAGTQFSHDGKGYVLSGTGEFHLYMETGEFWEYTPETDTWLELNPHPGYSRWAPGSFVIDDEIYLFCGPALGAGSGVIYFNDAYKATIPLGAGVGIAESNAIEDLQVYPNPSTDYLSLNYPYGAEVEIFSLSGELLIVNSLKADDEIDIRALSEGTYLIRITANDSIISQQFSVLRE